MRLLYGMCMMMTFMGVSFYTQAQYYPGGLGNGNLKLWLDAADATTLLNSGGTQTGTGNFVAKWTDKSGNNSHAVQATAGLQPIEQAGALNGYPGVIFQNANEYLAGPTDAYQTIVSVRSMPGDNHYQTLFASPANADFSIRGGGASTTYTDGPNAQDWCFNTGTTPTQWLNGLQTLNGSNTNQILVSSAAGATNATYSINSNIFANTRAMDVNDPVYEILSYSTTLSVTQREILENYEAVEWGLEALLPTSAYPIFTPPSLTSYYKNLVGIGYTSGTDNFLTNAAASTDGLGFSSGKGATDFLNTAGFVMAAHNGQVNTSITNTTISGIGSGLNLWKRSWYLQTIGGNSSGNITLNFNFNSYNGGTLPGGGANFYLLYNATDGSFATGTNTVVAVSSSTTATNAAFTVGAAFLPKGYYTIVWTSAGTQLITPSAYTVCAGSDIVYTALTTTGFTYQWQVNKGAGFANVPATDPGGAVYAGANTASLSITGVTASMSGYTYQVKLKPAVGATITLGPASLTVNANPVAGTIIGTASVTPGATTSLTDATGGGVWSSSNTSVATVSSSGVVTGIAYGAATISYTVTNGSGCSTSATLAVNVLDSHYFPGGLGNTNLKLWLDGADAASILNPSGTPAVNGDFVANWIDKSGNSNNAIQGTSGTQPVNKTGQLNGNGAVQFQTVNEYLAGPTGAYQTIVSVRNMPGTGHYQTLFASPANTDFSIRGGGAGGADIYTDGPNVNDWVYNTGTTSTQWLNGVQTLNGSTANQILVSSALSATNATYSVNSTLSARGMNGTDNVYELLAYNTTLNTTQRHILENYKAAKWGLGSLLPAAGYTVFTPPSVSTYNKNLVGIGYTSSTDNFLTNPVNASNGSTDGLGLSSGTGATDFLKSAGYLMAAHNGQAATILTNATVHGISSGGSGSLSVWNRSWYLQKTGGNTTGLVTMNFNFSDYNFTSLPATTYIYGLLYNATDGTFATGANYLVSTTSTVLSANNVAFGVSAANLSNGYYTLIWSTSNTLPITLESFTVTKQGSTSLLQWIASQDLFNGSFVIQRQTAGEAFSDMGTVAAAASLGNDASGQYAFTDSHPATGWNYYRLKMVDAAGYDTYSDVHSLDFEAGQSVSLSVFPNPVSDILRITSTNLPAPFSIRLIAIDGQVMKTLLVETGSAVSINVKDLPAGIYLVDINSNGTKYIREIIKR